jgi:tryptophanase
MSAVIYNTETTKIIKRYKTLAAAKAALTRAHNNGSIRVMTSFGYGRMKGKDLEKLAVCTMDYFNERVDYEVEVKNLMSGGTVKIRKSAEGTCVDPSTERYWSM